jgi:hypothetical protein
MSYGYSQRLVDANRTADPSSWGVLLGAKCIELGIPVNEVAERVNVSRATVYNWFWGVRAPSAYHCQRIATLLPKLKKRK